MNKNSTQYCTCVIICTGTIQEGGDKGYDEFIEYLNKGLRILHSQDKKLVAYLFSDKKQNNLQCYPYSSTQKQQSKN